MAASTTMLQTSALDLGTASKVRCAPLLRVPALAPLGRRKQMVRCEAGSNGIPGGLREADDQATKRTITRDDFLRSRESNESEIRKLVLGTDPTSGSVYPRLEIDRMPETGDKFTGVFAFDGAAPVSTINCRLAMWGGCGRF